MNIPSISPLSFTKGHPPQFGVENKGKKQVVIIEIGKPDPKDPVGTTITPMGEGKQLISVGTNDKREFTSSKKPLWKFW
ncbi:MAG: hypothetical protein QE263_06575 [Vampirovibrionales bacterium]|nr:hypothetical protein [Vampirovibrionales bacterium]